MPSWLQANEFGRLKSRFSHGVMLLSGVLLLSLQGCASSDDGLDGCGTVSGFLDPDSQQNLYRVVVTHLNGNPVISRPNYVLSVGEYEFTVAELIESPELKVSLSARQPKTILINVEANQRYHLAAELNVDKIYIGTSTKYWQPVVWMNEPHECKLTP